MKKQHIILALCISAFTGVLCAQDGKPPGGGPSGPGGGPGGKGGGPGGPGGPGGGPGGPGRMVPPIIAALDLNKDGIIDADELAKASESLKKLDTNGDGKLTEDEYRPKPPGGPGGPGGGQGGPGGGGKGGKGGGPGGPGGKQGGPQGGAPGGQGAPQRPPVEQ